MGADAVVVMRFDSSEIGDTMSEIVAYGTAVRLAPVGVQASAAPPAAAIERMPMRLASPRRSRRRSRSGSAPMLRNGLRVAVALVGLALIVIGGLLVAHGAPGGAQALILGLVLGGGACL